MKRLRVPLNKVTTAGSARWKQPTVHRHKNAPFLLQIRTLVAAKSPSNHPSRHYEKRKRKRQEYPDKTSLSEFIRRMQQIKVENQQQQSVNNQQSVSFNSRQASLLSPRTIVAQNILQIVMTDLSWRQSILQAVSDSDSSSDSLTQDYNTLLDDCLPSFQLELETNPELNAAMTRLVNSPIGRGLDFARAFRQGLVQQQALAALEKSRMTHQAHVLQYKAQATKLQQDVLRLKQELEELDETSTAPSPPRSAQTQEEARNPSSLWDDAYRRVTSMLDFGKDETEPPGASPSFAATSIHKKARDKLVSRIRHTERLLQTNQTLARTAQHHLQDIPRQLDHIRRRAVSLSEQDFQMAFQALERDRSILCQALARPLQERQAQLAERFQQLDDKTDLTKPHEWYPYARLDRRTIIYHGGPTNSGKTYQALERLKQARKGMYLGPLRLLAVEVYETLTAAGVYCSLYTGQEIQRVPFETHGSATVEMASLTEDYDVIVIDEIQMMADKERGFAWTRALLGSRCKEIHVCGGLEAKDLVERIASACGDTFELRTYERFTDLNVAKRSLASSSDEIGSYKNVRPGDCVVAFSRKDIFAIKREIETLTSHKCCVIYGSLPPLTRTEQARRFNDPESGYDVLVASDAVGMGLNLNIRRIVFNSIYKQDATGIVQLDHSMVKQISGRAGRRNSPFPEGEVTCRSPDDMAHLRKCMSTPIRPIQSAGLLPTAGHVELFHETITFYGLGDGVSSLHSILGHFSDMAKLRSDYFLCRQTAMVTVAKQLANLHLPIRDKYTLCMSPVVETSRESVDVLKRFATKLSVGEVPGLPQDLRPKHPSSFDDLSRLCSVYSLLELFLWCQLKFPPVNLMEQQTALSRKERTIELIGEGLALSDKLKLGHSYINRDMMLRGKTKEAGKRSKRSEDDVDDLDQWKVDDV